MQFHYLPSHSNILHIWAHSDRVHLFIIGGPRWHANKGFWPLAGQTRHSENHKDSQQFPIKQLKEDNEIWTRALRNWWTSWYISSEYFTEMKQEISREALNKTSRLQVTAYCDSFLEGSFRNNKKEWKISKISRGAYLRQVKILCRDGMRLLNFDQRDREISQLWRDK
jgi:hypothetical protein